MVPDVLHKQKEAVHRKKLVDYALGLYYEILASIWVWLIEFSASLTVLASDLNVCVKNDTIFKIWVGFYPHAVLNVCQNVCTELLTSCEWILESILKLVFCFQMSTFYSTQYIQSASIDAQAIRNINCFCFKIDEFIGGLSQN